MARCYTGCCDEPGPPCGNCSCCVSAVSHNKDVDTIMEVMEKRRREYAWWKVKEIFKKNIKIINENRE